MKKQIKRNLACLMAVITLIVSIQTSAVPVVAEEEQVYSGYGLGSSESPYVIENAGQMNEVRNDLSAYYVLENDIDLSGYEDWTPIGDDENAFTGHFNGNGHIIYNVKIKGSKNFNELNKTVEHLGVFGCIRDAEIQNLGVENASYDVTYYNSGNSYCFLHLGGIAGSIDNSKISQSYFRGNIRAYAGERVYVRSGGIASSVINSSEISNCYTDADTNISGLSVNAMISGIAAWMENSTIDKCYILGSMLGAMKDSPTYLAGFCASGTNGKVNNCVFALSRFKSTSSKVLKNEIGNFITQSENISVVADSPDVSDKTTYTGRGWDFDSIWNMKGLYPILQIFKGADNKFLSHSQSVQDLDMATYILYNKKTFTENKSFGGLLYGDSRLKVNGANAIVGDKTYTIDENQISIPKGKSITFKKENYKDYIIPKEVAGSWLNTAVNDINIYMADDTKDGKPYISTVYGKESQTTTLQPYKELQSETLEVTENKGYDLVISAVGADSDSTYYLTQDSTHNIPSDTGWFKAEDLYSKLDKTKKTYAYVKKSDGTRSDYIEVKINKVYKNKALDDLLGKQNINLVGKDGQKIKIDDKFPIVGGMDIGMDLLKFPVGFEIVDNRLRISLGIDIFKPKDDNEESSGNTDNKNKIWNNFKKQCSTFQKALDDADKTQAEYDKYDKNVKNFLKTPFNSVKNKFNFAFLGYAEAEITDNGIVFTDVFGSAVVKCLFDFTQQQASTPPIYYNLQAGTALTLSVNSARLTGNTDEPLDFGFKLKLEPKLHASAGLGIKNLLSAGVYGEVKFMFENDFTEKYRKLDLDGIFGIEGEVLFLNGRIPLVNGTCHVIEGYYGDGQVASALSCSQELAGASLQLTVAPRDYLNTTSEFDGSEIESSDESGVSIKKMQESVYPNGQYKIVTFGDKMMMVWAEDFAERDTYNRYRLVYSVYDNNTNTWSSPKAVYDSGKMDSEPALFSDGKNVYIAWQNINKVVDENDLESYNDILEKTEIMFAEYDEANDTFKNVTAITDNSKYDYAPRIAVEDEKPVVYWVECDSADYEKGSFSILKKTQDSKTEKLYTGLNYISDIECSDNEVSYIMDDDGDADTSNDILVYTNGEKVSDSIATSCVYSVLDGKKTLFYSDGTNIYYMSDGSKIKVFDGDRGISNNFKVLNNRDVTKLIWSENNDSGTTIYTCRYEDGKWTSPVEISSMDTLVGGMDAVEYNGQIRGVFNQTERKKVEGKDLYENGLTDMCQFSISDFSKISTDILYVDESEFIAGDTTSFDVFVKNDGLENIDKIKFVVSDTMGVTETVEKDVNLISGEDKYVKVSYVLPDNLNDTSVTISAIAVDSNGNERGNDEVSYELDKCDVSVDNLKVEDVGNFYMISGNVVNESGVSAKNVLLHITPGTKEDGKVETLAVGDMEPHSEYSFSYVYDKADVRFDEDGCYKMYVNVGTASEESIDENNKNVVVIKKEPDKENAIDEPDTEPTSEATTEPTTEATSETTTEPTTEATSEATTEPTGEATTEPTTEVTSEATTEPTTEVTSEATMEPTTEATSEATTEPTTEATSEATTEPTTEATSEATTELTTEATSEPTTEATSEATTEPMTEATTESTTEPTSESTEETTTQIKKKSQKLNVTKSYIKEYGSKSFKLNVRQTKGDGKITYTSSDKNVVTVSRSGKVSIKGTGLCTVNIQAAETDKYKKATVKINITVKPQKSKISKLKVSGNKSLRVMWKGDVNTSGYEIQYSESKKFAKKNSSIMIVKKSKITSIKISKLTKGKKYYIRVRSYKDVKTGGKLKRLYGRYSNVKQSGKIK